MSIHTTHLPILLLTVSANMSFQSVIYYLRRTVVRCCHRKPTISYRAKRFLGKFLAAVDPNRFWLTWVPVPFLNDCDDTPAGGLPTPVTAAATTSNTLLSPLPLLPFMLLLFLANPSGTRSQPRTLPNLKHEAARFFVRGCLRLGWTWKTGR
jgi:hypothetical protein